MKSVQRFALAFSLCAILGAWYVDPGSSSLLWQLVLSGMLGIGFAARRLLAALRDKVLFRRRVKRNASDHAARL